MTKKKNIVVTKVKGGAKNKKKINVAKSKSSPKVCHKVCPKKAVGYFSSSPPEVSLVGKVLRFLGLSK